MIDCERVLRILKDKKPHRNFDLLEIFGGGFALAARIWDLRKPIGRYRLSIISGSPKKFGKKRISTGDWYYQLVVFDEDGPGLKLKYFSMFSGIGGFEYGIEKACQNLGRITETSDTTRGRNKSLSPRSNGKRRGTHADCIGYSEIDKYAIQIYKKHFPNHKEYGDATRIIPEEIPDFDLLVGGFPCQSFSIAGKRGGFKDTRGTLFFEIARIVSVKRPKLLLLENVKGLLSHDKGRTFGTILATLSDMGYVCEWQILNSKNFGVPQNRERIFIVGYLGEISGQTIFPFRSDDETYNNQESSQNSCLKSPLRASGDKAMIEITKDMSDAQRIYDSKGIAKTLKGRGGGQGAKTGLYAIPVLTPNRAEKRQNGRRFKKNGDPSFMLTGQDIHGVMVNSKIRRLTPTECERLQGFPDGWTEGVSDTQRYKCLGNAVTTNVVTVIIKRLAQGIFDF